MSNPYAGLVRRSETSPGGKQSDIARGFLTPALHHALWFEMTTGLSCRTSAPAYNWEMKTMMLVGSLLVENWQQCD